ncbi:hypothetical protein GEV37_12180 [Halomonas malpeensis]|uniref:Uncharacterized protein n=1 Tax=Vreelandella malpeensis TaxID=1172368 RepID=A0ABS8DUZ1_9GAMM|nr:hypothetical protein [Halomonas malpeensis]
MSRQPQEVLDDEEVILEQAFRLEFGKRYPAGVVASLDGLPPDAPGGWAENG